MMQQDVGSYRGWHEMFGGHRMGPADAGVIEVAADDHDLNLTVTGDKVVIPPADAVSRPPPRS